MNPHFDQLKEWLKDRIEAELDLADANIATGHDDDVPANLGRISAFGDTLRWIEQ